MARVIMQPTRLHPGSPRGYGCVGGGGMLAREGHSSDLLPEQWAGQLVASQWSLRAGTRDKSVGHGSTGYAAAATTPAVAPRVSRSLPQDARGAIPAGSELCAAMSVQEGHNSRSPDITSAESMEEPLRDTCTQPGDGALEGPVCLPLSPVTCCRPKTSRGTVSRHPPASAAPAAALAPGHATTRAQVTPACAVAGGSTSQQQAPLDSLSPRTTPSALASPRRHLSDLNPSMGRGAHSARRGEHSTETTGTAASTRVKEHTGTAAAAEVSVGSQAPQAPSLLATTGCKHAATEAQPPSPAQPTPSALCTPRTPSAAPLPSPTLSPTVNLSAPSSAPSLTRATLPGAAAAACGAATDGACAGVSFPKSPLNRLASTAFLVPSPPPFPRTHRPVLMHRRSRSSLPTVSLNDRLLATPVRTSSLLVPHGGLDEGALHPHQARSCTSLCSPQSSPGSSSPATTPSLSSPHPARVATTQQSVLHSGCAPLPGSHAGRVPVVGRARSFGSASPPSEGKRQWQSSREASSGHKRSLSRGNAEEVLQGAGTASSHHAPSASPGAHHNASTFTGAGTASAAAVTPGRGAGDGGSRSMVVSRGGSLSASTPGSSGRLRYWPPHLNYRLHAGSCQERHVPAHAEASAEATSASYGSCSCCSSSNSIGESSARVLSCRSNCSLGASPAPYHQDRDESVPAWQAASHSCDSTMASFHGCGVLGGWSQGRQGKNAVPRASSFESEGTKATGQGSLHLRRNGSTGRGGESMDGRDGSLQTVFGGALGRAVPVAAHSNAGCSAACSSWAQQQQQLQQQQWRQHLRQQWLQKHEMQPYLDSTKVVPTRCASGCNL
ncbi:hypothetical protein CLOM_g6387 [Closterium sp. NIES-68]|nr:hypothetical protein CLOM_g6387 [Closterium sp. NIES-68]GJP68572.1 hypothetical protein CLOP_g25253 [Closterium sp. NIES-67]